MTAAKLSIDIRSGLLEVEGEESFVKSVYDDFRKLMEAAPARAVKQDAEVVPPTADPIAAGAPPAGKRPRKKAVRTNDSSEKGVSVSAYQPKFLATLDTMGLKEFYAGYAPNNHSEKILIFLRFLKDMHNIEPASFDQVFTCYQTLRERVPLKFAQAFLDCRSKHHFIDFSTIDDVRVAIPGNNHFNHDLAKAVAAK